MQSPLKNSFESGIASQNGVFTYGNLLPNLPRSGGREGTSVSLFISKNEPVFIKEIPSSPLIYLT